MADIYGARVLRNWDFVKRDGSIREAMDDASFGWKPVLVPHDWAQAGPFDRRNDAQDTRVGEDGELGATLHEGRTGGLPHTGEGWYRARLEIPSAASGKRFVLSFDGVMSHSTVYVNGREIGGRPYGYSSFELDATEAIVPGGENVVHVHVDNPGDASRWYPGAGLYRPVRLLTLDPVHFSTFGVRVHDLSLDLRARTARVRVTAETSVPIEGDLRLALSLTVGDQVFTESVADGTADLDVAGFDLWSPDHPALYDLEVSLLRGEEILDRRTIRHGFRTVAFRKDGMTLNGIPFTMKGVCLHHDLGPLGAAVSVAAIRRQLLAMKSIGCNAIRTSHNPPAPQLLDECDRMGFVVMDEAFDEWRIGKTPNGYHVDFDEWHERDLADLVRRDRNHPCVVLWSIGNEIREQGTDDGYLLAARLQAICHRHDPTRKVTSGINHVEESLRNGYAAVLDVPGWNYHTGLYGRCREVLPEHPHYASETASTVSSRGYYRFPVREGSGDFSDQDHQCSSFDKNFPPWACSPDTEFAALEGAPWMMGEFVWTGIDYLGEPTPYNNWPSHVSYFGIFDLCVFPKDRAWIYAARWSGRPVLHLLPHWTWPGLEGKPLPVHAYTNAARVELFVNGRSQGIREPVVCRACWDDVAYEPGELLAVAYDADGNECGREKVETSGFPAALRLSADRPVIAADGDDLAFVKVEVVDAEGRLRPDAAPEIRFRVEGAGALAAVGNGDSTNQESFAGDRMAAFHGLCLAVLRAGESAGEIVLTAEADGLAGSAITIRTRR